MPITMTLGCHHYNGPHSPTPFLDNESEISDQFLEAYDAGTGVVACSGMAPQLRTTWRSFIDPCGLGTLMPEEETESPEEVRSQRRRSLPNVDE